MRPPCLVVGRLARDRRGVFGIIFALLALPLIAVLGVAVDYARLVQFKTQLQATVDSAALSGAAAYVTASDDSSAVTVATNYMTANEVLLPSYIGTVTKTISATQVASGANEGNTVTVSATGQIGTTFLRIYSPTMTASATAVAVNPQVSITITANNFRASAGDGNTLWYWEVTSGQTTTVPNPNDFASDQKLASNTTTANSTVTVNGLTSTQQLGIALQNVTGEVDGYYGCTQYQTASGLTTEAQCYKATQWFFSNTMPPSDTTYYYSPTGQPYNATGYQAVTQNCSVQTALTATLPTSLSPPTSGSCFSSLPTDSIFNCGQLNGQYLTYYWNDMGGYTDDKDYNDAEISISCAGASGSGNSATTVYLAQ